MSDLHESRPWFQRRVEFGYGYRPASWQGWAATLALLLFVIVTALLGDPTASRPDKVNRFIMLKADIGLSGAHLPFPVVMGLMIAEVVAFVLFVRWRAAPLKPVDGPLAAAWVADPRGNAMSDANTQKPWFRPKVTGTGWTPQTWQGWLITLAFVVLFAATVQMVMPQGESLTGVWPWLAGVRRDLGVPDTGLGLARGLTALGLEIAGFSAIGWWMSRSVRPLD